MVFFGLLDFISAQDTINQNSSQGFSFRGVRFDAGVNMGLECGLAREEKILADTGEFVGGADGLGEFHGMFLALGRTNQIKLDAGACIGDFGCGFVSGNVG